MALHNSLSFAGSNYLVLGFSAFHKQVFDHPIPGNRQAAIEKEVSNWPPKELREHAYP